MNDLMTIVDVQTGYLARIYREWNAVYCPFKRNTSELCLTRSIQPVLTTRNSLYYFLGRHFIFLRFIHILAASNQIFNIFFLHDIIIGTILINL